MRAGTQDRPLWQLRQQFADQRAALHARDPRVRDRWERQRSARWYTPIERHEAFALIVLLIPFSALGIGWAGHRPWAAAVLGGCASLGFSMLQIAAHRTVRASDMDAVLIAIWTPVALIVPAAVWIARRENEPAAG